MEHSAEDSHEDDNGKKPRSLDLQTLCDQNPGLPLEQNQSLKDHMKRKHALVEEASLVKKKTKKGVLLSSLASGKNSKRSSDEVSKGGSGSGSGSSDSSKAEESGQGQKSDNAYVFGGASLNPGGDAIQIPKRRRDLVRRKKVDDNQRLKLKLDGILSGDLSSGDMSLAVELNGGLSRNVTRNGNVGPSGEINGKLDQNGNSTGNFRGDADKKEKRKKNFNDHKENWSNKFDLVRQTKRGNGIFPPETEDSSSKKVKRNHTKRKGTGLKLEDGTKEANPVLDQSDGFRDVSLDDDEENLEANAARMLSSRFNSSCTHFLSNSNSYRSSTPCCDVASLGPSAQSGSDTDTADRVLRPRDQHRQKGIFRRRRHFYEVFARDLDPRWMLQRKTKVYWPLDQIWYYGKIIGFDPDNNLHHIRYDDQEEEWIDLCNERFKLLLFPSELPYNRRSRRAAKEDRHSMKGNSDVALQDDHRNNESEPIISWLSKSSHQIKSSASATRKKQKMSKQSDVGPSLSPSLTKNDEPMCLDVGSSEKDADEHFNNTTLHECPTVLDGCGLCSKPPIVYVRRRFRSKERGLGNGADNRLSHLPVECGGSVGSFDGWFHHSGLSGSADDLLPVVMTVVRLELTCPVFLLPYYSFGLENLSLFHTAQMLQYGTLMTLWPMVHLEMLFVDNIVGLSFLLFNGCLKQAIMFLFLILNIFHRPNQEQKHIDEQLPVTSIRFQFSFLGDVRKRLVFAFYSFSELGISKWNYLYRKLKKDCFLAEQLPASECTYENIKVFEYGFSHFPLASALRKPPPLLDLQRRSRHCLLGDSESWADANNKQIKLPSFSLSFVAASPFFLDLHLMLLMKHSVSYASFKDHDSISLPPDSENSGVVERVDCSIDESSSSRILHICRNSIGEITVTASPDEQFSCSTLKPGNDASSAGCEAGGFISKKCHRSQGLGDEVCLTRRKRSAAEPGLCDSSAETLYPKGHSSIIGGKTDRCLVDGITVEIPPFDPPEGKNGPQDGHESSGTGYNVIVSAIPSPKATNSMGMLRRSRVNDASSLLGNLSPLPDGRPDLIASGPKKPRTQVSYSMPVEGPDLASRFRSHKTRGFSHKRIRRATERKVVRPNVSRNSQRKMETLYCDVNVLVIASDQGWREDGAKVVLELFDHSEWRLAVKICGFTKYSYKAHQFLQSGSTNRYTHAMMWKGGKDWILEFPDRSQWAYFKEMHEECYDRNLRAASMKNIPIPGVCLIEESDDNGVERPFVRPSPKYFRQIQNDVDIAMDPSNVLYDMDSDDEWWVAKIRSCDCKESGLVDLSDEMFEKIMDMLEKIAYARKKDNFACDELEDLVVGDASPEEIKIVREYWREKRQKKGMPLIRHFQPPLWEKYQQQVKEWELATSGHEKAAASIEKPPMYAFCLKPRGLELINRGSKHRSHKKLSVSGHSNMAPPDSEAYHSSGGRRFNGYAFCEEKTLHAGGFTPHGFSDSFPLLQASTKMISPRGMGSLGYFLNGDGYERNHHYPKLHGTKSKKTGSFLSPTDKKQVFPSHSLRILGRQSGWSPNLPPEWASLRYRYHPDGPQMINFEQLDPSDLDEFRLRDASSVAQHAMNMAKLKREKAQRLLYRADLAIHKAVVALMTAEAIKATTNTSSSSMGDSNRDACSDG